VKDEAVKEEESDEDSLELSGPIYDPGGSGGGTLGLINGTYSIEAPSLDDWEEYDGDEFTLELRLMGQFVWGYYNFGMHEGVLCIPRRPYSASGEKFEFTWRGHENGEGEMSFGPGNRGWIQFLGNGNIEGEINCWGTAHFSGWKESDHAMDFQSMKAEWDRHNQENYEYANHSRWG
jgi:hypothetical protein